MNRREFFKFLSTLPFVGLVKHLPAKKYMRIGDLIQLSKDTYDIDPLVDYWRDHTFEKWLESRELREEYNRVLEKYEVFKRARHE